jgi:hypothetical protein
MMCFSHMIVKIVSSGEGLSAKLAGPEYGAGEMNVLHMLLQIAALCSHPPAQAAAMTLPVR